MVNRCKVNLAEGKLNVNDFYSRLLHNVNNIKLFFC